MSLYTPDFFVGRSETVNASAAVVVPIVQQMLAPRSVLDVGCGQGEWLEAFAGPEVFGVDIAAPEGEHFLRHDLTEPLYLWRKFDLVLSLEVGEHLPEEAAFTYVASLARHGDCVLFSAAVPGQEGKGHINCQPHEYWHERFYFLGFEVTDPIRPLVAGDVRVSPWYRDNIFLYQRFG
jgi:SAM-dependent methyltransferase